MSLNRQVSLSRQRVNRPSNRTPSVHFEGGGGLLLQDYFRTSRATPSSKVIYVSDGGEVDLAADEGAAAESPVVRGARREEAEGGDEVVADPRAVDGAVEVGAGLEGGQGAGAERRERDKAQDQRCAQT